MLCLYGCACLLATDCDSAIGDTFYVFKEIVTLPKIKLFCHLITIMSIL